MENSLPESVPPKECKNHSHSVVVEWKVIYEDEENQKIKTRQAVKVMCPACFSVYDLNLYDES